jgi:G3E family GTPase
VTPAIPTTIVTGFLGAGKSTLLRRLLASGHDQRIALIVNELGPGGTDEAIGGAETQALELPEGCVCCLRNPELIGALSALHASGGIDRTIIETTGVADPLALTWTLDRPDVAAVARLDGVVTVVDVVNWPATRSPEWESQIIAGDLVVLSKLDVAPAGAEAAARQVIAELNPAARILPANEVPLSLLLDLPPAADRRVGQAPHHSDFTHVDVVDDAVYALETLEDYLEALPPEVFRAKGQVRIEDGRWAAFHVVGGRLQLDPDVRAPAHGQSRIVFFGRRIRETELVASTKRCRSG